MAEGLALWVRDPVDVALRVYGLAVLISRQIDLQCAWIFNPTDPPIGETSMQ
jgi:hypothetical protein